MILAAGPAVSFALWGLSVGIFAVLANYSPDYLMNEQGPTLLARFLYLNGEINFWLGVFNSLPIYPLNDRAVYFQCYAAFPCAVAININFVFIRQPFLWQACSHGGLLRFRVISTPALSGSPCCSVTHCTTPISI